MSKKNKHQPLDQEIDEVNQQLEDMMGTPPLDMRNKSERLNVKIMPDNPSPEAKPEPEVDEAPKPDATMPPADKVKDETTVDDTATDSAVNDIVAKEGDEVLAAEDSEIDKAFEPDKQGWHDKLKRFFVHWWQNKKLRWATIGGMVALLFLIIGLPVTRYFLLNSLGVRSSASLTVLDGSTTQPLKNVKVSLAGQSGETDSDGKVRILHLKLGSTTMTVQKLGFAVTTKKLTIGWGSNPLSQISLTATGTQYNFSVIDFMSGKPVANVEATSGDANSLGDDKGKIKLTTGATDETSLNVSFAVDGYRTEIVAVPTTTKTETIVKLVPAHKLAFVSKRSGKYDLYKVDLDGKNESVALAGTGLERDDIALVPHPTDNIVAFVSTREDKRNTDNFLLSTLTLVDLDDNSTTIIGQSERFQLIGWSGSRLVFAQIIAGASGANPKRQRLFSYDYKTSNKKELASANYFNDVAMVHGVIYYAPSSAYQPSNVQTALFKINADGSNLKAVFNNEVWNIFRLSYDKLDLSTSDAWYEYTIADGKSSKLPAAPANLVSRTYMDSPDSKHSAWVDSRDGKGVLLSYDPTVAKDTVLKTQSGLNLPTYWLNNSILVYRIVSDQETADYAISLDGGQAIKVRDVTNTSGVSQWYYY